MAHGDSTIWSYYQGNNRGSLLPSHPRHNRLFSLISKSAPVQATIVDVGFGDGYLLKRLSEKFKDLHGVDISEENIKTTSEELPSVSFHISENNILPFSDGSVDVLVTSEVLEHMSDQELEDTKNEALRVLRKGGLWISTVPAREVLQENFCVCPSCGHEFHRWGHKRSWTRKTFLSYFDSPSFTSKITEEFYAPTKWYLLNTIEYVIKKLMLVLGRSVKDSKFLAVVTKS